MTEMPRFFYYIIQEHCHQMLETDNQVYQLYQVVISAQSLGHHATCMAHNLLGEKTQLQHN